MKPKTKLPYIIAVDFDGTLCENKWPNIGEPNKELIANIRCEQECKGTKIILWTCRSGRRLKQALKWCKEQGLIFDAVNRNLPEVIKYFGSDTRKIFAHEYIDDKNRLFGDLPYKTGVTLTLNVSDEVFSYAKTAEKEIKKIIRRTKPLE